MPVYPWELSDDSLRALELSEPPADAAKFDHEVRPNRSSRSSPRAEPD
jgi:hypothetical protein